QSVAPSDPALIDLLQNPNLLQMLLDLPVVIARHMRGPQVSVCVKDSEELAVECTADCDVTAAVRAHIARLEGALRRLAHACRATNERARQCPATRNCVAPLVLHSIWSDSGIHFYDAFVNGRLLVPVD